MGDYRRSDLACPWPRLRWRIALVLGVVASRRVDGVGRPRSTLVESMTPRAAESGDPRRTLTRVNGSGDPGRCCGSLWRRARRGRETFAEPLRQPPLTGTLRDADYEPNLGRPSLALRVSEDVTMSSLTRSASEERRRSLKPRRRTLDDRATSYEMVLGPTVAWYGAPRYCR
jgi:hypothetical protein